MPELICAFKNMPHIKCINANTYCQTTFDVFLSGAFFQPRRVEICKNIPTHTFLQAKYSSNKHTAVQI